MTQHIDATAQKMAAEFARIARESQAQPAEAAQKPGGFGDVLEGLLNNTADMQRDAEGEVDKLVKGETDNINDVMLAVAKADVSFKMMLEVRNKLLDAYHEVMRMQV